MTSHKKARVGWSVFDERVVIEFSPPEPLDHADATHRAAVSDSRSTVQLRAPSTVALNEAEKWLQVSEVTVVRQPSRYKVH